MRKFKYLNLNVFRVIVEIINKEIHDFGSKGFVLIKELLKQFKN